MANPLESELDGEDMELSREAIQNLVQGVIADTIRTMHSTVDMEARNNISAIQQAQQSHERICFARDDEAKQMRKRMDDKLDQLAEKLDEAKERVTTEIKKVEISLEEKIQKVHSSMWTIIWTGACSLIILLVAIVAFFMAPYFEHHP